MLAKHALYREYAEVDPYPELEGGGKEEGGVEEGGVEEGGKEEDEEAKGLRLQERVLAMAAEAAKRFARLGTEWIRVGYVQSNFNSDNCLAGGSTVDYGPFGFLERYICTLLHHTPVLLHHTPVLLHHTPVLMHHTPVRLHHSPAPYTCTPAPFSYRYDPEWGMWIGSGRHFAFMNQPAACGRNLRTLMGSLEPLMVTR
jgi:uncharacterized protein YdiU (UPF0061 family)